MSSTYRLQHEIRLRIAYCGPAQAGKSTSIRYLHGAQPASSRGQLVSENGETHRLLSYSFPPTMLGLAGGHGLWLDLRTIPGPAFYESARKRSLEGADGVVFVADSLLYRQEANLEHLEMMARHLDELGVDSEQVPLAFQYNKRDLTEILPVARLDRELNPFNRPSFVAIAHRGIGVVEPLRSCVQQVMARQGGPYRAPARS